VSLYTHELPGTASGTEDVRARENLVVVCGRALLYIHIYTCVCVCACACACACACVCVCVCVCV